MDAADSEEGLLVELEQVEARPGQLKVRAVGAAAALLLVAAAARAVLAAPPAPAVRRRAAPDGLVQLSSGAHEGPWRPSVTIVKESVGDIVFEDSTSHGAEAGAWAAPAVASAVPYGARETIDLLADENTKLLVSSMEEKFQRCALIGASPLLKGKGHGSDIDRFDIVIRVNRVPTREYYEDFGQRTDILYSNALEMYSGEVTLMGHGDNVTKRRCGPALCDYLGMVFRGDYGCDFDRLQRNWGEDFVLGCTARNVTKAAYGFRVLESAEPTSGFMAFLTFAPLCRRIVLYGFSGDGAIDGHTEWKGHSLNSEHQLLHWIEGGDWDKIELPESRDWLQNHVPVGPDGLPAVHVVQT